MNAMIPASMMNGTALSTKFANVEADALGEGIKSGFAILGYRGKVWSTKFQGAEKPLMREDGDGARASVEVVIVKAAPHIAKIFYEAGFEPGSTAPPDCWSTDGVKPDGGASKKQSATCAGCPKNAWGSKVTEAGKQTKACSDSKRLAIVPLNDMTNELMGGPMLLRVPAASLKDLKTYGDQLQSYGFPYFGVATRIAFDVAESFPKFVFTAMRPLTDQEADVIIAMREDARVNNILNTSIEVAQHEPEVAVPASPFENGATAQPAPAVQAAVTAQSQGQPAAAPAPAPAQAAQPAQVQTGVNGSAPPKPAGTRTRRTKAEMEAAAAALRAQREGAPPPTTTAAQPAAAQPQAAQPAQQVAPPEALAAAAEETAPAPDEFDAQLDALLPV